VGDNAVEYVESPPVQPGPQRLNNWLKLLSSLTVTDSSANCFFGSTTLHDSTAINITGNVKREILRTICKPAVLMGSKPFLVESHRTL
jgi:hypothetical protein